MNKNKRKQSVHHIVKNLKLTFSYKKFFRKANRELSFGWTQVWLPERPDKPLCLIVFLEPDKSPVALLTNETIRSAKTIARFISYYLTRYTGCEDPVRFLKQEFKLEKFRIESMAAIRNWFFWISVASTMLFDFHTRGEILKKILDFSQSFPNPVKFIYYRILRGINYLLRNALPYFLFSQSKIT